MGIFSWLSNPPAGSSSGLFNVANEHWKTQKSAALAGNEDTQIKELLEVIRLCQQAVVSDKKAGDAYVLLANALLIASDLVEQDGRKLKTLRNYASGVIAQWWSLPHKKHPITKNYETGLQVHQAILDKIQNDMNLSQQMAETLSAGHGEVYGANAISSDTYEDAYESINKVIQDNLQTEFEAGENVQFCR